MRINVKILNLVILSISFIGLFLSSGFLVLQLIFLLGLVSTFWISYFISKSKDDTTEVLLVIDEALALVA